MINLYKYLNIKYILTIFVFYISFDNLLNLVIKISNDGSITSFIAGVILYFMGLLSIYKFSCEKKWKFIMFIITSIYTFLYYFS